MRKSAPPDGGKVRRNRRNFIPKNKNKKCYLVGSKKKLLPSDGGAMKPSKTINSKNENKTKHVNILRKPAQVRRNRQKRLIRKPQQNKNVIFGSPPPARRTCDETDKTVADGKPNEKRCYLRKPRPPDGGATKSTKSL